MVWIDGTTGGRTGAVLERKARGGLVFPEDFGALGGNSGIDELPQLQAAVDSVIGTGKRLILTNPPYWIRGTLLVGANMRMQGPSMNWVGIARLPGSGTGPAIREKTSAEGNPSGATGLWITDMTIRGSYNTDPGAGGVWDAGSHGLWLGDQVSGAQLNFNAGVFNVMCRGFMNGRGIYLNQNASVSGWLTAATCMIGMEFHGGNGTYIGLQGGPSNQLQDVIIAGLADNYFSMQTEFGPRPSGLVESIKVLAAGNTIEGLGITFAGGDIGNAVLIATGNASKWSIKGFMLRNNDAPTVRLFQHAIYFQTWGTGTGPTQTWFPHHNEGGPAHFYNLATNETLTIDGKTITAPHMVLNGAVQIGLVANTAARGSASIAGAGAQRFDLQLGIPIWSNGTAWCNSAGVPV